MSHTFEELSWRVGRNGEIIDQWGGVIAGDPLTCVQSLTMRATGTDRFERTPEYRGSEVGECQWRWEQMRREQAEYVKNFFGYRPGVRRQR